MPTELGFLKWKFQNVIIILLHLSSKQECFVGPENDKFQSVNFKNRMNKMKHVQFVQTTSSHSGVVCFKQPGV